MGAGKAGVGFGALDNGFVSCEDPRRLWAIADGLSAEKLEALSRKGLRLYLNHWNHRRNGQGFAANVRLPDPRSMPIRYPEPTGGAPGTAESGLRSIHIVLMRKKQDLPVHRRTLSAKMAVVHHTQIPPARANSNVQRRLTSPHGSEKAANKRLRELFD